MTNIIVQLKDAHGELLTIINAKTALIKDGKMDEFQKLLMSERKHLQKLNQLEDKRIDQTEKIFDTLHINTEDKNVTILLEHLPEGKEKESLEKATAELIDQIVEIKHVEQLNTELVQQSMEFIQLSLDMLQPSIRNMNYNQKTNQSTGNNKSVFDSKA